MLTLWLWYSYMFCIRQRTRLHTLQGQHSDLLGLLAQQEIELQIFSQKLNEIGGSGACNQAEKVVRDVVAERYGSYINFRDSDENVVL